LKVQSIAEEMQKYQKNWKEHVERMQDDRLPKLVLKYHPVGKRSRGRPKNRRKDQFLEELKNTGLTNLADSSRRRTSMPITLPCNASFCYGTTALI
jgi:hypothetical protein